MKKKGGSSLKNGNNKKERTRDNELEEQRDRKIHTSRCKDVYTKKKETVITRPPQLIKTTEMSLHVNSAHCQNRAQSRKCKWTGGDEPLKGQSSADQTGSGIST